MIPVFAALTFFCGIGFASSLPKESHLVSQIHNQKRYIDEAGNYKLTILHVNDVHAHLDSFVSSGTDCVAGKTCYGGYARIKTKVDELRAEYPDSLLINAGDEFQGTLFYTYLGESVIADTINRLGFDAMTLGNHEFDGGLEPLTKFITSLNFPTICANIQSTHVEFQSLLIPYKIFPNHGLAIVAVTTADIPGISNPGEGTDFLDPIETVQKTVDYVLANENVNRVIVVTHIGYEMDILLAKSTRNVHLVVGGHSHTLLGNFTGAEGEYPTIEHNLDGEEVFIVTSYKWGQYLGKIDIAYNSAGKIVEYNGAPILMNTAIAQEPELQEQVLAWRKEFDAIGQVKVGSTETVLDVNCQTKECTMGDLITDAMVWYRQGRTDGALMNSGGLRAAIDVGDITKGETLTTFPFMNSVVDIPLTGKEIWDVLEDAASLKNAEGHAVTSFVQVSDGIKFAFDPKKPQGSRLVSLEIGGAPVDLAKTYILTTVDYIANGGDYLMPKQKGFVTLDTVDVVFSNYIQTHSPLHVVVADRIQQVDTSAST